VLRADYWAYKPGLGQGLTIDYCRLQNSRKIIKHMRGCWKEDLDCERSCRLLKKGVCSVLPADGARRPMARINAQISVKGENF